MDSTWSQVIAAVAAAVIPFVVKVLNDLHDRMVEQRDKGGSGG